MSSNFIFKGQQGYPLSAIVDEPNLRVNGFTTAQSSVHLICQKNQGMQHPTSQYVIVNCQIVVDTPGFAGKVRANIDSLLPTLSHYISQVIVRQFVLQNNFFPMYNTNWSMHMTIYIFYALGLQDC